MRNVFTTRVEGGKILRRLCVLLILAAIVTLMLASIANAQQIRYYTDVRKWVYDDTKTVEYYIYKDSVFKPNGVADPKEIYIPYEQKPFEFSFHNTNIRNGSTCGSCHNIHYAEGKYLLRWSNIYDICLMCHDGTISTAYNVVEGRIRTTDQRTFGGMFGLGTEQDLSVHTVNGAVSHYAAPGGSTESVAVDSGGTKVRWGEKFGCESCHNPHGIGGNGRLLSPDPNYYQWEANKDVTWGNTSVSLTKIPNLPDGSVAYVAYPNNDTSKTPYYILNRFPYDVLVSVFVNGVKKTIGEDYNIDSSSGSYSVVKFYPGMEPPELSALTAQFVPSMRVKMDVTNYLAFDGPESVAYKGGINTFCGACHTDYNTEGQNKPSRSANGQYSEAYRHAVGSAVKGSWDYAASNPANVGIENNKYMRLEDVNANGSTDDGDYITCLTCHLAHGTSENYWKDVVPDWAARNAVDQREQTGSSALKRLPNMDTCEVCHVKRGDQGYFAATEQTPFANAQPLVGKGFLSVATASFVGSAKCQSCHQEYVADWQATWHAKDIRPGLTSVVASDFEIAAEVPENLKNDWLAQKNGGQVLFWSQGKDISRQVIAYRGNTSTSEFRIIYEWRADHTLTAKNENYDTSCWSDCHTTGVTTGKTLKDWIDAPAAQKPFELNITCEKCHGPGGNHVKIPNSLNIINPGRNLTMQQQANPAMPNVYGYPSASCGSCHDRGKYQSTFYKKDYYDLDGDGQKDANEAEYGPSKHYLSTIVTCSTCHNLHGNNVDGKSLKTSTTKACRVCHDVVLDFDTYMPNYNPDDLYGSTRRHDFEAAYLPEEAVNKMVLSAPSGLAAVASYPNVNLSWNSVKGASSYKVYRSTTSGGEYTEIASGVSGISYNDTNPAQDVPNYYVVTSNTTGVPESGYSTEASATPILASPQGFAAVADYDQVNLSWNSVTGASSYNVYRSTIQGGPYITPIASGVSSTSYTDTSPTLGVTNYYIVRANASGGAESGSSNEASAMTTQVATAGIVQDTSPLITYSSGDWSISYNSSNSGGSYYKTDTYNFNNSATLVFRGSGISFYALKVPGWAKADIYLDNNKVATVDFNNTTIAYKQLMFSSAELTNGVHTMRIVRASADGRLAIDNFVIQ